MRTSSPSAPPRLAAAGCCAAARAARAARTAWEVIVHAGLQALDAVLRLERAVSMQIGMRLAIFSSRASSRPLSPGIITSSMMRSKVSPRMGARACRVGGGRDAKAVLVEIAGEEVADLLVVVDDEDVRGVVGQRISRGSAVWRVIPASPPRAARAARPRLEQRLDRGRSASAIMAKRKRRAASSAPGRGRQSRLDTPRPAARRARRQARALSP